MASGVRRGSSAASGGALAAMEAGLVGGGKGIHVGQDTGRSSIGRVARASDKYVGNPPNRSTGSPHSYRQKRKTARRRLELRFNLLFLFGKRGGRRGFRTPDPYRVKVMLYP